MTLIAPAPPVSLDYARGADMADLAAAAATLRWMVALAVLSGLCVGSCFVVLATEADALAVAGHAAVFWLTLATAVWVGRGTAGAGWRPGRACVVMDCMAGAGLAVIGFGPLTVIGTHDWPSFATLPVGVAYALLAGTTVRHLLLYRGLARLFREAGRGRTAGLLAAVGWIKMFYEAVWLGCCALGLLISALPASSNPLGDSIIFFALGAAYGTLGFGAVWLLMLIAHTQAVVVARRATRSLATD